MRSLKDIIHQNNQAAADHNPALLSDVWPEGQAFYLSPSESQSSTPRSRFTLSSPAIIGMAQHGLGFDLSGLYAGVTALIRSERRASPSESIEPDSLDVLAFTLAAAPAIAATWTEALLSRVKVYEDEPRDSFSFDDYQYRIVVTIHKNVVTAVTPLPKRNRSERRD